MKLTRNRVVGGILGFAVAVGGGVALAAVLNTTVEGSFLVDTTSTSNSLVVEGSKSVGLDCSNVGVSQDFKKVTVKAVYMKRAVGPNGDPAVNESASCVIKTTVKNTGDTPLKLTVLRYTVPPGWTVSPAPAGAIGAVLAKGQSVTAPITLTATKDATAGTTTGAIAFEDAPVNP